MSKRKRKYEGTAAWRRLSDEVGDEQIERDVEALGIIADGLLHGRIDVQFVASSLRILGGGSRPCPHCLEHEVAPRTTPAGKSGVCVACHLQRQSERHRERVAEIEAVREVDKEKQAVRRARIAAGLPLPRSTAPLPEPVDEDAREFGAWSWDAPAGLAANAVCRACDRPYPGHSLEDGLCTECADRTTRRKEEVNKMDTDEQDSIVREIVADLTGAIQPEPDAFLDGLTQGRSPEPEETAETDPFAEGLTRR